MWSFKGKCEAFAIEKYFINLLKKDMLIKKVCIKVQKHHSHTFRNRQCSDCAYYAIAVIFNVTIHPPRQTTAMCNNSPRQYHQKELHNIYSLRPESAL